MSANGIPLIRCVAMMVTIAWLGVSTLACSSTSSGTATSGHAGASGTGGTAGSGGTGGSAGASGTGPTAPEATSCKLGPLDCGPDGDKHSCCEAIYVPGGDFMMGRSLAGTDACDPGWPCSADVTVDTPEHKVTVRPYFLDRYKVTVARFRRFVDQYTNTPPAVGAGAHPSNPKSGWQADWNQYLPATKDALVQEQLNIGLGYVRYTEQPGAYENIPATASFALANMFCIWDGGRLVTEPEWEFAAAGGEQNLRYPWGHDFPSDPTASLKICQFAGECYTDTPPASCSAPEKCHFDMNDYAPVGTIPLDVGPFGHENMAEIAAEWVNGNFNDYTSNACGECVEEVKAGNVLRRSQDSYLKPASLPLLSINTNRALAFMEDKSGAFRCARDVPATN